MNDFVRDTLCRMIQHHGRDLSENPSRCAAMLSDLCPKDKRSVNVIVCAARERIPADLMSSQTVSAEAKIERLSRRLQQDQGLADDAARWGVESWALALGIVSADMLAESHRRQRATAGATSQAAQGSAAPAEPASRPEPKPQPKPKSHPQPQYHSQPQPKPRPQPRPEPAPPPPPAAPAPQAAKAAPIMSGEEFGGLLVLVLLIAGGIYYYKVKSREEASITKPAAVPAATASATGFSQYASGNSTDNGAGGYASQDPPYSSEPSERSFQVGDPNDAKELETFLIEELKRQIPGSNVEVETKK